MIDLPTARLEEDRVVFTHQCLGESVEATLNSAEWRVTQEQPLTVEPSVSCGRCGLHGWITNGWFHGQRGRRRHDPGELMEEPDLYPKTFDPDDERAADDAHMRAMEDWMEHEAEEDDRG